MKQKRYGRGGWFNESRRHALARRGIKTGRKINYSIPPEISLKSKRIFYSKFDDLPKNMQGFTNHNAKVYSDVYGKYFRDFIIENELNLYEYPIKDVVKEFAWMYSRSSTMTYKEIKREYPFLIGFAFDILEKGESEFVGGDGWSDNEDKFISFIENNPKIKKYIDDNNIKFKPTSEIYLWASQLVAELDYPSGDIGVYEHENKTVVFNKNSVRMLGTIKHELVHSYQHLVQKRKFKSGDSWKFNPKKNVSVPLLEAEKTHKQDEIEFDKYLESFDNNRKKANYSGWGGGGYRHHLSLPSVVRKRKEVVDKGKERKELIKQKKLEKSKKAYETELKTRKLFKKIIKEIKPSGGK